MPFDVQDEPKGKTCVICLRKGHKTKECNQPCAWLCADGLICGGRAWDQHREGCQFRSMYNDDRTPRITGSAMTERALEMIAQHASGQD